MKTEQKKMRAVKMASQALVQLNLNQRNTLLSTLATELENNIDTILQANAKDLALIPESDPRYDRLQLTADRIKSIVRDIANIIALPDPLGTLLSEKTLLNGLVLKRITVPMGVIGVIYESRPNVTIDVFVLCFKSGNACILKGGKEAWHTNQALITCIFKALFLHQISSDIVYLMPPDRDVVYELLNAVDIVDVCIPRGSQILIDFVREHAKVPVIETGAGIVHTYFDHSGDLNKGMAIIDNAKTRRVSVCNALDTLIIHQARLNDLAALVHPLAAKQVDIFADELSFHALKASYSSTLLHQASIDDFGREFLSYKMSIKTVSSCDEAIRHIMQYTSGHSEAIIAEDKQVSDYFLNRIDAAVVYVNVSTAFTDGGEFGMGGEIGISTQKLHARGPMGLEALTSYKWLIYGNGQVRA